MNWKFWKRQENEGHTEAYWDELKKRCSMKAFGNEWSLPENGIKRKCMVCKKVDLFRRITTTISKEWETSRDGSPIGIYACDNCGNVIADTKPNEIYHRVWMKG